MLVQINNTPTKDEPDGVISAAFTFKMNELVTRTVESAMLYGSHSMILTVQVLGTHRPYQIPPVLLPDTMPAYCSCQTPSRVSDVPRRSRRNLVQFRF